mgnify:CR=1 FL=1
MNALAKLDQLNLDADTKIQIQMLFEQSQKEIHSQQLKIQALTMELAYLRRNLFGKKSESLSAHSDLFEETLQTDLAAVHAEIEQLSTHQQKPIRLNQHVPALAASRYQNTCHVLNTVTSLSPVNAISVARIWSKSVKMLANSWMWSQQNSSFTVTSAHNMPARPVKTLPPHLSRQPL